MLELELCSDEKLASREGFKVTTDSNIAEWSVTLSFDDHMLQDLLMFSDATGHDAVVTLAVSFPADFPNAPPFVRVVRPRFHQYTAHVTIGGSICVQDLTMSGWNPQYAMPQVLLMVRDLLSAGGALINMDVLEEYGEDEAREAFIRVAQQHGWIAIAAPTTDEAINNNDADADADDAAEASEPEEE